MGYTHNGPVHMPAGEDEARAKFAYFREAEAGINGGPAPIETVKPRKVHRPIRPRLEAPKCGTYSGWSRHNRDGTKADRLCMDAQAEYMRDYRATLRQKRAA